MPHLMVERDILSCVRARNLMRATARLQGIHVDQAWAHRQSKLATRLCSPAINAHEYSVIQLRRITSA
jgi:hypothetical protein